MLVREEDSIKNSTKHMFKCGSKYKQNGQSGTIVTLHISVTITSLKTYMNIRRMNVKLLDVTACEML